MVEVSIYTKKNPHDFDVCYLFCLIYAWNFSCNLSTHAHTHLFVYWTILNGDWVFSSALLSISRKLLEISKILLCKTYSYNIFRHFLFTLSFRSFFVSFLFVRFDFPLKIVGGVCIYSDSGHFFCYVKNLR